MPSPFHVRRIEILDQDAGAPLSTEAAEVSSDVLAGSGLEGIAVYEWIYEIADEAGQVVLALPFEAAIKLDSPDPDCIDD